MSEKYSINSKVYPAADNVKLSMSDMLEYFEKHGAMRVSDLHLKIGTPPAYRIDGDLVKLRGPNLMEEHAKALIYSLLDEQRIEELQRDRQVDSSYRQGNLQYRINAFYENDGLCAAIRALGLDIPKPDQVGFPNDVWKDIVNLKQGLVLFFQLFDGGY